ncbi:MAG: hypothetical protein HKN12_11150, partial [Gemmatimonadetes bacterium]|nr:hypothetical protein [Gemmatimonadota bacterium]
MRPPDSRVLVLFLGAAIGFASPAAAQFRDASSRMPARTETTLGIAWGDFDGDGDFDLFLTTYGDTTGNDENRLLENLGGRFVTVDAPLLALPGHLCTGAAWG